VDDRGRWRIEELAERAELSVYTLRFYQRQRLLPSGEQNGKAKWYGPEHLARLHRIRDLQEQGFSLAAIRVVLDETAAPGVWGLFATDDEHITSRELRERTGVTATMIDELAAIGALGDPRRAATSRRRFDAVDQRLLTNVKMLSDLGLPDSIVVSVVSGTVEHLDALGRHNQDVMFGDAGDWSDEEREGFRARLPENMEHLRDAVAWMVRLLQLRSAQHLLLSSGERRRDPRT
jgi:DNA-binding transcriptional MerR regulator